MECKDGSSVKRTIAITHNQGKAQRLRDSIYSKNNKKYKQHRFYLNGIKDKKASKSPVFIKKEDAGVLSLSLYASK
jgi:hypothetical protein